VDECAPLGGGGSGGRRREHGGRHGAASRPLWGCYMDLTLNPERQVSIVMPVVMLTHLLILIFEWLPLNDFDT